MTVLGIDISRWQATTPSLDGLGFCFVKATEGTASDPAWPVHSAHVRAAGIILGAYAFGVRGVSGHDAAAALIRRAPSADLYALDVEGATAPTEAECREFGSAMHAMGKTWGLYHSASGYPSWGQDWRWVAQWGPTPPAQRWDFWQRRGSPLDLDTFRGTSADLHRLARVAPQRYRVAVKGRTSVYDHPNGAVVGTVSLATYNCTRFSVSGKWWYRIDSAGSLRGRYLPAQPWMEVTAL